MRTFVFFIMSLFTASVAHADLPSRLSVGGGIALPSARTAVHTNPAGLTQNSGLSLSLQAGSNKPWKDPLYRGQLALGNGYFGLAGGMEYQSLKDPLDDRSSAFYGLGVKIPPLGLSLGVSGWSGVKGSTRTDYNAGLFFEPTERFRLAATAKGLEGSVDEYGAGLAFELVGGVAFTVDAAFDSDLKENELKPGLYLGNRFAGVSVSYGTGETEHFKDELSAGVFLRAAFIDFEFLYRAGGEFPDYYGAFTFGF